ncbi:Regulator of chromosome condensation [Strongyloides ratti]|uniref:Regulator of chromosome condensation n=1 Tax=Strongyloides ratti TaxID=34506 RepID=A0A090LBB4_STRRB|nr:Regulator of chromosome condensation [Strongyloides ratti]CEF65418.1 Regulator of chromosome condensation [Strongyloides ratti]
MLEAEKTAEKIEKIKKNLTNASGKKKNGETTLKEKKDSNNSNKIEEKTEAIERPPPSKRGRRGSPDDESDGNIKKVKFSTPPPEVYEITPRPTPNKSTQKTKAPRCPLENYINTVIGDLVLTCGTGEQIGHGQRNTTRKPRGIMGTLPKDIIDIAAGGVHSVLLTENGDVYSCGINEKGTIPLKDRPDDDCITEFTKIEYDEDVTILGKFVAIDAGASFSAAVTEFGSVVIWGDLRDAGGEMNDHGVFEDLREGIKILIDARKGHKIVKIAAGENHLVCLSDQGELFTFGDLSKGQLGRVSGKYSSRKGAFYGDNSGDKLKVPNILNKGKVVVFVNVFAGGYWTMAVSKEGDVYVAGLNNFDQLGFPAPENDEEDNRISSFKKSPVFAKEGLKITHACGAQHIIVRYDNGEVYSIGRNIDNALGLGTWKGKDDNENWKSCKLNKIPFDVKIAGATAGLGCSIVWDDDGNSWSWGADTSGQLGLGISEDDDDKMVPEPKKISSKHLEGKRIFKVSIADNHSVFLACDLE